MRVLKHIPVLIYKWWNSEASNQYSFVGTRNRSLAHLIVRSRIRCFDAMYVSASMQVRSRILRQISRATQHQKRTDSVKLNIAFIHSKHKLSWTSVCSRKSVLKWEKWHRVCAPHLSSSIVDARTCTFAHQVSPRWYGMTMLSNFARDFSILKKDISLDLGSAKSISYINVHRDYHQVYSDPYSLSVYD